jgi:predicted DCC family thiol-disulfide oxidoreductase YuxK
MITVFYDGKCGLCSREINHYRKIATPGVFAWIDITVDPEPFTTMDIPVNEGLKALHVINNDGKLHKGVDAFIIIWQALAYRWRFLAAMISLPVIHPAAKILYRQFANWRFKHLGYDQCKID